jgi:hypothetical protein
MLALLVTASCVDEALRPALASRYQDAAHSGGVIDADQLDTVAVTVRLDGVDAAGNAVSKTASFNRILGVVAGKSGTPLVKKQQTPEDFSLEAMSLPILTMPSASTHSVFDSKWTDRASLPRDEHKAMELSGEGDAPPTDTRLYENGQLIVSVHNEWQHVDGGWDLVSTETAAADGKYHSAMSFKHSSTKRPRLLHLATLRLSKSTSAASFGAFYNLDDCVADKCTPAKHTMQQNAAALAFAEYYMLRSCALVVLDPEVCLVLIAAKAVAAYFYATALSDYQNCLAEAKMACQKCYAEDAVGKLSQFPGAAGSPRLGTAHGGARTLDECTVDWEWDVGTPGGSSGSETGGGGDCWYLVYYDAYGNMVDYELLFCEDEE